jgi:hypothetical protein
VETTIRNRRKKKVYEVLKKATKLDITEDFTTQKSHRKSGPYIQLIDVPNIGI